MESNENFDVPRYEKANERQGVASSVDEELSCDSGKEDEIEQEEDEEEEEPRLKYSRITSHLGTIYRNGDATSAFLVAGDKMFIGSHDGNVHIVSLLSFQFLRVYRAHSASISSISISPFPPPLPNTAPEGLSRFVSQTLIRSSVPPATPATASPRKNRTTPVVPNNPSNAIYIATSSIDGNVCVQSLIDVKDVQLRSFGRPVQAVALSPEYKHDKTYISGGLAGNLVLTIGGKTGINSTSTITGSVAATASGWLGAIGLSGSAGKDTILHSGEGIISTIKWSLSGNYVVWINEQGVKIMRSNLHLSGADNDSAWKRIGHIDRPDDQYWGEMASAWKARVEWVNSEFLQTNEVENDSETLIEVSTSVTTASSKSRQNMMGERLLIGWGGTIWIVDIHPDGSCVKTKSNTRDRSVGRPEIIKILNMDCIISGISLYSPTVLLILAYAHPEENRLNVRNISQKQITNDSTNPQVSRPRGGIQRFRKAQPPELRLIDLNTSEEIDTNVIDISRYESLSASDYHLGILQPVSNIPPPFLPRGTIETLAGVGSGMWNATVNATSLLSSSASIRSNNSRASGSTKQSVISRTTHEKLRSQAAVRGHICRPGMKIFVHSPYDCILATKRDLSDHLAWLLEHNKYQDAWELIDEHPEILSPPTDKPKELGSSAPELDQVDNNDLQDDSSTINSSNRIISFAEKEKCRVGELWIQQIIEENDWVTAGKVCGKVLKTSQQWEKFARSFINANRYDEITDFIPVNQLRPPLNPHIYELILSQYITQNISKAKNLLERWPTDLFIIKNITTILENRLKYRDVREDSIEDGQVGRDWRIVMELLGKLYISDGHPRDSLKYYIKLQDADTAMNLIKSHHLVDALAEDIPGAIMLGVSNQQIDTASIHELKKATSEMISLLVNEAHTGLISPQVVVQQLLERDMTLYLFFYVSSLWRGDGLEECQGQTKEKLLQDGKALVDPFADLIMHLFASYDRNLLMEFLKSSTNYTFEKATQECEERDFIPELVYLYSKTGQTKRALYLVIDRLADVSQAISFAKEQNDNDLWEDLLNYSMDKPLFIRGLLEEVGTAINPITFIRRIPEGLEIEGLRDGLKRIIKDHEIQYSISYGVAKVLRSEVAVVQNKLWTGQQKGVKFEVAHTLSDQTDEKLLDMFADTMGKNTYAASEDSIRCILTSAPPKPGHCVACRKPFTNQEIEIMVGFACGHVWHVSHLLSLQNHDRPITPPEVNLDENNHLATMHSVGTKVTHARLLKDKLAKGCLICNKILADSFLQAN